jgi:penicillin-binding protein 2
MAFGQGTTAVTPIEMANAYATFANGGTRYAPEVAAAILDAHGHIVIRYQPRVLGTISLPASIRNPILQGLLGVVNSSQGTAYGAFKSTATFPMNSYLIAGKTGTASNSPGQEPNSWFVGFGPNPNPQYVVLAVVAQGGYGASAAAPIVARTFNYLYSHPVPALSLTPNPNVIATTTTTTSPTTKSSSTSVKANG